MSGEEDEELIMTEEELKQIQMEVEKDEQLVHRKMQLSQVEEWVKQKERENNYTRQLYNSAKESVLECESVIKGLYGMLDLEYRDTDSEEEREVKSEENVIQITDNGDGENDDFSMGGDDYVVIDLGAAVSRASLKEKSKASGQTDKKTVTVKSSSTSSLTSASTLHKSPVITVSSPKEMDTSLSVKTRESPVPISSSPSYDGMSSTPFTPVTLEIKRESSPSRSPEPSSFSLVTIKTRESPVPIKNPPSPDASSPTSFRPICVPKKRERSPSNDFFPTIKTRESPVSISNIPSPDTFHSSSFIPITSTKKEIDNSASLEPSSNLTIKTRESPVSISSTNLTDNMHSSAFIPFTAQTKKDLNPSMSPTQSNNLTIKIRQSPVPISSSSPDVSSPPSPATRNSTPDTTESSALTDSVAADPKTVVNRTSASAKQNVETAAQLKTSHRTTPLSTESSLGSTTRVSLNAQRQVSSSTNSNTQTSKTAGESPAVEKTKVTSSKSANNPSSSVTSSTTPQSEQPTKATISGATVSSRPSVADTATSARASTPAPTSTTTTSKPSDNKEVSQVKLAQVQKEIELKVNMNVLGRRRTKTWHQGTILEIRATDAGYRYKVKFEGDKGKSVLSGHHIASAELPMLKDLFVGCRVVARYKEENQSWLHSAVITEMPDRKNRMRFMVFFDDGRSAYISLPDLHMVCKPLKNIYEDIEDESCRAEVVDYLQAFPNPIFVVVRVGQESKAERDGRWEDCIITQVDGSLIQICYTNNKQKEWLYKGSSRLDHIQRIKKRMANKKTDPISNKDQGSTATTTSAAVTTTSAPAKTTAPTVTTQAVVSKASAPQSVPQTDTASTITAKTDAMRISQPRIILQRITLPKASVSTSDLQPTATSESNKGTKRPASAEFDIYPSAPLPVLDSQLKYVPHRCCPACLDRMRPTQKDQYRGQNPLRIPLLYGFRRMTARRRLDGKMSFHVFYRAPCGRSLCEMEDVQDYLCESRCDFLFLEMFCLDPFVLVKRALPPSSLTSRPFVYLPDFSEGKEVVPVPCVNERDSSRPSPLQYTRHRVPAPGVFINTSLDFMVGCDCTDGCRDRSKCSCHQLTIEATSLFTDGPVDTSVGYTNKRLNTCVPTGLYECNPLCRCDPWMCSNRLVQHGQQLPLQLFMTQHKGWGIRCLDDVSKGTFVCVFTGKIVTDDMASTEATMSGNEYLVNLDYIEGVEKMKEGYESEAYSSDTEEQIAKKNLVMMTTGSVKKHDVFKSDCSSGEETEVPNQPKKSRRESETDDSSDNDVDTDDLDDEDYTVSSDDNVEMRQKHSDDDCQRSYITRRNAKGLNVYESFKDRHPSLPPEIAEEQTQVSYAMARQMRRDGPAESGTGFARKSTHNFAIKSSHRRVKPLEVQKDSPEKKMAAHGKKNTRSLFSNEEACYLIDTKQEGNIARYINHSCSPNLFVQNVFVDTHDLRFPWVAFFTSKRIRAGTELTWDYSYEVGSVEGKVLLCCCGSAECTGRLL